MRLTLDCADLCATIGRIVTRGTGLNESLLAEVLNTCALVCRLCGDECESHAGRHEHCRICAAACRSCAEACGEAIRSLRGAELSKPDGAQAGGLSVGGALADRRRIRRPMLPPWTMTEKSTTI